MWIEVLSGPDAGHTVRLPDAPAPAWVLGRVRGTDLVVRDERASRRHAELEPLPDGRVRLRDLGSANGTFVGEELVTEATLEGGEELRIGDVRLRVTREEPAAPAPTGPAPADGPDLTLSMVGRMVAKRDRPVRVAAFAAAGLAAVAVLAVVLLSRGGDGTIPEVVRELSPSVVRIEAERELGSGFVLADGLVVTNAHVVNGGLPLRAGGRPAELVGVAPCADLAILRADTRGRPAVRLGRSVEAGETVVAVGYPAGADTLSSTTGVVSAPLTAFRDPAPDVPGYPEAILTDTALNPGNSGGPLANARGEVVGVNAAARTSGSDGRPLQGQGYALPVGRITGALERLRGGASPGWIGVTFTYPSTTDLAERRLPGGLFVASVVPGSPAAGAGVRVGDLIVGAGRGAVRETLASWCAAVGDAPVSSLEVIRDGERRTLRLTGDA